MSKVFLKAKAKKRQTGRQHLTKKVLEASKRTYSHLSNKRGG